MQAARSPACPFTKTPIDRVAELRVIDGQEAQVPPEEWPGQSAAAIIGRAAIGLDPHAVRVRWLVSLGAPHLVRWRSMLGPRRSWPGRIGIVLPPTATSTLLRTPSLASC